MNGFSKSLTLACALLIAAVATASADDALFGKVHGYVHPTLGISAKYNDNFKEVPTGEKSDWTTIYSLGLWLSLPASGRTSPALVSSNAAPGGAGVSRFQDADFRGFQGTALYRADIEKNDHFSKDDSVKHTGQGMLQYAFANGLTLEVSDIYVADYDDGALSSTSEREEFTSNRANAIVYYKISPKLTLRAGYADYSLDYKTSTNLFKERSDDQISTYVLYQILPKTQVFVQYDYIDMDYDENILNDAKEHHYFVGLKFDSKARISGHIKAGYGTIDVDAATKNDYDDLIGDAQLRYAIRTNSSIALRANQIVKVASELGYHNILHREAVLSFNHKFNPKLDVTLSSGFKRDEHRVDSDNSPRTDSDFVAGIGFGYTFNRWLKAGLKYDYTDRDSNIDSKDYKSNVFLASLAANF